MEEIKDGGYSIGGYSHSEYYSFKKNFVWIFLSLGLFSIKKGNKINKTGSVTYQI